MSGRVTGTVKIRGREFKVNCIERMDHRPPQPSEVQRAELDLRNLRGQAGVPSGPLLDLDSPVGKDHTLAHGYVLDEGQVYGLTDMELTNTRIGIAVVGMDMKVTDVRGKVFHLHAMADVVGPWNAYAATVTWTAQWLLGGQVGYGCVMETIALPALHLRRGRAGSRIGRWR